METHLPKPHKACNDQSFVLSTPSTQPYIRGCSVPSARFAAEAWNRDHFALQAGGGVLDLEDQGTYRPKTRDTQAAYETLLAVVQGKLGDHSTDIIAGGADEVLGILKSTGLKVIPPPPNTPPPPLSNSSVSCRTVHSSMETSGT